MILFIITGITFVFAVCFYLFSIHRVSGIYIGNTQETIVRMEKDFLKETVDNLIVEIDSERETRTESMEDMVLNTASVISMKMALNEAEFNEFFVSLFENNIDCPFFTVLLWDNIENKAIYDPQNISGGSWEEALKTIEADLAPYRLIIHGHQTAVFGISKSYIDELVKSDISEKIRKMRFDDDSYIWVNEILNYQGGENYAIRRVHPNLPETEGMYLSTGMTDVKGNLPYLTELEGINQDGELYFTYYFKELVSNKISEKLTYAKLYPDYNWIIAFGIYKNDLNFYINRVNEESSVVVSRLTIIFVSLFAVILIVSYGLIMLIEKSHYRNKKRQLESEMNQDSLTKAGSRRSGTIDLNRAFKDYKRNGSSPGIMMFDIDYFKNINDTYGHAAGDMVLTEIVRSVHFMIRSSDRIIRWGGDEFIVIFYGLHRNNARGFGEKILSMVSSMKIEVDGEVISPTLSIGFSYFRESDTDYNEVLKRADQALYQSKERGRNQINLLL